MPEIHSTAVVDPSASIAEEAIIGPYCVVGPRVVLGRGVRLISHVVVDGLTTVGDGCTLYPFVSVGLQTQDLKFKGGSPGVVIGSHTTLRESVTVHAATYDGGVTTVGDHCHIMAYAHIAHDCHVGDRVIMANAATLAGHVVVEEQSIIGGLCGVHQFVRIGRLSITGGCSKVVKDVPPFMMADGNPLSVHTINKVGLERAGVSESTQQTLRDAFKLLYRKNLTTQAALAEMAELPAGPELEQLMAFVRASERGITR
ncbi:MAG TPA: acyl-ACP--UDP-N-acetylglucosamine O-acyltransferase [Kiritimatiellia bacterium]|nr:acyl-ACP--UDP-N-acetylglucosamine O-acyltransferase [Kiritimatiellia bacterium]HMO98271.1 acyl-ACP--UDP-N-acetylglucosamine O-acyltransferase [Kiritimatiellia bacterium]HMP96268.1 acyl-ACP--UDP-N-acetylglucosamine O-acyltransferase [Kiritimatiellia bacterium]